MGVGRWVRGVVGWWVRGVMVPVHHAAYLHVNFRQRLRLPLRRLEEPSQLHVAHSERTPVGAGWDVRVEVRTWF